MVQWTSEAIEAAYLELEGVNVVSFLAMVAENAHFAGIGGVCFVPTPGMHDLQVRADDFSLEDVLTHVLRNAARHRKDDTPITLSLSTGGGKHASRFTIKALRSRPLCNRPANPYCPASDLGLHRWGNNSPIRLFG